MICCRRFLGLLVGIVALAATALAQPLPSAVHILRVPDGGIQPQVAMAPDGTIDLIYFRGDAAHGDLYLVRSRDGVHFSAPIQVNHQPGSALAVGNVRGAHIALGAAGQVYVAWVGSGQALPRGPKDAPPMLVARMNASRTAFLPEQNVVRQAWVIDGGAVAADAAGNVYVFWHAPGPGGKGEAFRRVWMARSTNGGHSFQPEQPVSPQADGVCGCCGMNAVADGRGDVTVIYRSARAMVHRDEFLLTSRDHGRHFSARDIGPWQVGYCVMSTADLVSAKSGLLAAWEQEKQVHAATMEGDRTTPLLTPPGSPGNRAHPVIARDAQGRTLLAWTEGMGWQRGGSLAWQLFDADGHAAGKHGAIAGVPVWSLVAAWPRPGGGFVVMY